MIGCSESKMDWEQQYLSYDGMKLFHVLLWNQTYKTQLYETKGSTKTETAGISIRTDGKVSEQPVR